MESTLYRYIFRHSASGQIIVLVLSLATMPLTYLALEVPKQIINSGIGGQDVPEQLAGVEITQVQYLLLLCGAFLGFVVLIGGLKYVVNVYKGVLGERLLRRLRYLLYVQLLRFRLPEYRQLSQGELIAMVTAETEPLGEFMGDSVAGPALQGGMLVTYLAFIFAQDVFLGLAAIALYPLQIYMVPKLQRRVNELSRERVRTVRKMADRIGEGIQGITEIHAHGTSRYERTDIAARLARVFDIRFDIYKRKFFIKFLNNFIASLTPFLFYSIGGYFVIRGDLTLGALVAVLAAYKDLSPPWKELLKYYQRKEDMQVKYDQVVERFRAPATVDDQLLDGDDQAFDPGGDLVANKVGVTADGGVRVLENVSFTVGAEDSLAVLGPSGGGKDEVGRILARLEFPTTGQLRVNGVNLAGVPEPTLARHFAYVGQGAFIFAGSVRGNLAYGLKRRPFERPAGSEEAAAEAAARRAQAVRDAELGGTITDDIEAEWIDYEAAGVANAAELDERMLELLSTIALGEDVYHWGLNSRLDAEAQPEFAERLLEARRRLRERIAGTEAAKWVEPFDAEAYNANATVAENVIFGTPADPQISFEDLAHDPYVAEVLETAGIYETMVDLGRQVAQTMVELFADLPEDHEFFEQYAFIRAEDLPAYRTLLGRVASQAPGEMGDEDREQLLGLAFKIIPARHRLGLIDEGMQERILEARRIFARDLPARLQDKVAVFDAERFNRATTIQDNILFGKVVTAQAEAQSRIGALIEEVVRDLDLRRSIARVGLDYEVGTAGGRLSYAQRQKLAIGRCLLKRPQTLIMNEATTALDAKGEEAVIDGVLAEMAGGRVVCVLEREALARRFQRVVVVDQGTVVNEGRADEVAAGAEADMARAK